MSAHDRIRRQQIISQAEGYLELGMARHALEVLARYGEPESFSDHAALFARRMPARAGAVSRGDRAFRAAAQGDPDNVHIWLALGWCQKRVGRIDLAIEALEEALAAQPDDALIHYNLACYWSLAHNKRQALIYPARDRHEGALSDARGRRARLRLDSLRPGVQGAGARDGLSNSVGLSVAMGQSPRQNKSPRPALRCRGLPGWSSTVDVCFRRPTRLR